MLVVVAVHSRREIRQPNPPPNNRHPIAGPLVRVVP